MRKNLPDSIKYIESFLSLSERSNQIRESLKLDDLWGINIGKSDARILQFLIKISEAKKIVEIGSLYGFSACLMLEALPIDSKLWALELSKERSDKIATNLENYVKDGRLIIKSGQALESLVNIEPEGPFDCIFIDANKAAYLDYLLWAKKNIKKNGLIIGDNTFLFGNVWSDDVPDRFLKSSEVMKKFNEELFNDDDFFSVILPTEEGMTIGMKIK